MDKKQLMQLRQLKREIESDTERISSLRRSRKGLDKLYEQLEHKRMQCIIKVIEIEGFISAIDDSLLRQIFELRYVKDCTWAKVAALTGGYYSEDYVRIRHDRYLKAQKPKD